jgi:hypothetical protein
LSSAGASGHPAHGGRIINRVFLGFCCSYQWDLVFAPAHCRFIGLAVATLGIGSGPSPNEKRVRLGEKQCWNNKATVATVQWSAWVYSLMMLAGFRAWGNACGAKPPGSWQPTPRRWSFNTVWRGFRTEMWQQAEFRAAWTWSWDSWLEKETLWHALLNSTLASARV